MFRNLSEDIAFLLVRKRIVDNEKREMYSYGAEVILLNTFNLLISFIISLFSSTMSHFMIFVLVFIPLRMSIGGYHAKTSGACAIISTLLYIASIVIPNLIPLKTKNAILLILFALSVVAIFIYAPIENENNLLSSELKKRNRLTSLILASADSIATIIACIFVPCIASSIMIFVILASALMLISRFKR